MKLDARRSTARKRYAGVRSVADLDCTSHLIWSVPIERLHRRSNNTTAKRSARQVPSLVQQRKEPHNLLTQHPKWRVLNYFLESAGNGPGTTNGERCERTRRYPLVECPPSSLDEASDEASASASIAFSSEVYDGSRCTKSRQNMELEPRF